ncbi:hypothetical protein PTB13_23135, partial [Bacillus sp. MHSD17]|nr:hypothetical protein [Bacillus sp. MHSD17]
DGGNHRMDGSTFPFNIFGNGWERHTQVGGPSGLRKTNVRSNSLAHRTTWLRSDFPKSHL